MKNFKLIRFPQQTRTLGVLFCDNEYICDTLEDRVRDTTKSGHLTEDKVYGETAIPYGTYKMIVTYSPAFKKDMVLVCDVPSFEGIRLHWGATEHNSLGCILVGKKNGNKLDNIGMTDKLTELVRGEEAQIEII